jgi:hypothetical protein
MTSEWYDFQLEDVADLNGGYAFKSEEYTETGHFVLRTVNITDDGRISTNGAVYVIRIRKKVRAFSTARARYFVCYGWCNTLVKLAWLQQMTCLRFSTKICGLSGLQEWQSRSALLHTHSRFVETFIKLSFWKR